VTGRVTVVSNPPFPTPPLDAAWPTIPPTLGRPSYRFEPLTALFDNAVAVLQHGLGHPEAFTPLGMTILHALDFVSRSTEVFYWNERVLNSQCISVVLLSGERKLQQPTAGGAVRFEGFFVYPIFQLKIWLKPRSLQSLVVYSMIVEVTSSSHSRRLHFH